MSNINNLAQGTNYTAGSSELDLLPFYLTTVNIPGLNFSHPEIGGRTGAKLNLSGDSITYNTLSMEVLIDEDFQIYDDIITKIYNTVSPNSGSFANTEFNFWVQINNSKGNPLFKLEFFNCRFESVGDIQLNTQDSETEHTMALEVKYDYYRKEDNSAPTLLT